MSAQRYCELMELTGKGCYYLWGPIQNALLIEFLEGREELIAEVVLDGSPTEDGRIPALRRDLLSQMFIVAGQENRSQTSDFLYSLAIQDERWAKLGDSQSWNEAKSIAAQVSSQITAKKALLVLLEDKNDEVRRAAVGATFHLWQDEKEDGKGACESQAFKILQELSDVDQLSRLFVPTRRRFQSCFELSLSILFDDYDNTETTDSLLSMWREIIQKYFWYTGNDSRLMGGMTQKVFGLLRYAIIRFGVGIVIAVAKSLEEENSPALYDVRAVEDFFGSSEETKERYSRMVPYVHAQKYDLKDAMEDLKSIVHSRDLFSNYLLVSILSAHIVAKPQETLEIMKTLLRDAMDIEPGLPSVPMINIALSSGSDGKSAEEIDPSLLELNEYIITQYQTKHDSICEIGRRSSLAEFLRSGESEKRVRFTYSGLSSYPQYAKKKYQRVNANGMLDVFMENAKQSDSTQYHDLEKIHNYIANVSGPGHPKYRDIDAVLECLEPIVSIAFSEEILPNELTQALTVFQSYGLAKSPAFLEYEEEIPWLLKETVIIQEELSRALAIIKVYAPDEVEDFMASQNLPREFRKRVHNRAGEERMASAVKGRAIFFIRDEMLLKPESKLAVTFRYFLGKAPCSRSFGHWLSQVLVVILDDLSETREHQLDREQGLG